MNSHRRASGNHLPAMKLEQGADDASRNLFERALEPLFEVLEHHRAVFTKPAPRELDENFVFVGEVLVERPDADAGPLRDRVGGERSRPTRFQHQRRRTDDALACISCARLPGFSSHQAASRVDCLAGGLEESAKRVRSLWFVMSFGVIAKRSRVFYRSSDISAPPTNCMPPSQA